MTPAPNDASVLGHTVYDRITGFRGVATGYVQYLTGCNQVLVVPPISEGGVLPDSQWFDVQRLLVTGAAVVALDNGATPGCDRAAPKR